MWPPNFDVLPQAWVSHTRSGPHGPKDGATTERPHPILLDRWECLLDPHCPTEAEGSPRTPMTLGGADDNMCVCALHKRV